MKKSTALSLHNGCWLADDWQCYNYGPAPHSQWDSGCAYPLTYGADFYVGRIELPEGVNAKLFSTDSSWPSLHGERCNARMAGNPQTIEGPTNGRSASFWTYQSPRVGVFQFEPSGDSGSCRSPSSTMIEPMYRNVTIGELMIA